VGQQMHFVAAQTAVKPLAAKNLKRKLDEHAA
jgi:hypothetical protein